MCPLLGSGDPPGGWRHPIAGLFRMSPYGWDITKTPVAGPVSSNRLAQPSPKLAKVELSAFATDAALTLAHHEVPGAPDEVAAAQMLISDLGLKGVLFTADALHCQKEPSRVRPRQAAPCWSVSKPTSPAFSIA